MSCTHEFPTDCTSCEGDPDGCSVEGWAIFQWDGSSYSLHPDGRGCQPDHYYPLPPSPSGTPLLGHCVLLCCEAIFPADCADSPEEDCTDYEDSGFVIYKWQVNRYYVIKDRCQEGYSVPPAPNGTIPPEDHCVLVCCI